MAKIRMTRKRDGRIVPFDQEKITNAIFKAAQSVGGKDRELSKKLSDEVVSILEKKYGDKPFGVEEIQDVVEKVLIEGGHARTSKSYILYRETHKKLREARAAIGVQDDLKLSINALKVLEQRYLKRDKNRKVIETPSELFARVAANIAEADKFYGKSGGDIRKTEEEFYRMMAGLEFMPNSPTLMNAGRDLQQLSACFVLPVPDSMDGIFDSLKCAALVHQSGGGTGFSFTDLRPKGDIVKSTGGIASGPVTFMRVFNTATDVIKQGGTRRGANMGILRVDHPDILEFITAKEKEGQIDNFNISVVVTKDFMEAVKKGEEYNLINPRTCEVVSRLNAKSVFDLMVTMAWKNGEPGIIFIDRINEDNPTPKLGKIMATNPCIAGGSLVSTGNGLERMEELVEEGEVSLCIDNRLVCLNLATSEGTTTEKGKGVSFSKAVNVWKSGKKSVMKLKTKSGFELTATPDHRVMTTKGWVPLGDLKVGVDKVLLQGATGKFSDNRELGIDVEEKLNLPSEWSLELGQVVGWLLGDGWLAEADPRVGFTFSKEDRGILEYLKPIINSMYGKEIKEVERENGVFHLSYHSKPFLGFFKALGISAPTSAENKRIPNSFYTAPKEAVIGLLQGLFASDGTVGFVEGKSSYARLTSKSRDMLKGVQLLLLNLGIRSRIYDRSRQPSSKFEYTTVDGERRKYESDGILYELEVSKENLPRFMNNVGFIGNKHVEKIEKLLEKGYYQERFEDVVAEVSEQGIIDVYDLTEPLTHSFIANGIVVSNCGEQPLLPYEACNLGSINLNKMLRAKNGKYEIDYEKLKETIQRSVHFLDNVIDMSKFPIDKIRDTVHGNRKIGLGVMGWADLLVTVGIPYNSEEATKLAEKVMSFIHEESVKASQKLAEERGVFPNWKGSVWGEKGIDMRNATINTIAPTGSISIITGCSSGVEPLFAVSYVRRIMDGMELIEMNPHFERMARERGFYDENLIKKITKRGTIQHIDEIPEDIRRVFVTAHDIQPEWHVRMQAAFQRHTDNAVSKTINFPADATIDDVRKAYMLCYELGCKGITVYRDRSREKQVLNIEEMTTKSAEGSDPAFSASSEYAGGCTTCTI